MRLAPSLGVFLRHSNSALVNQVENVLLWSTSTFRFANRPSIVSVSLSQIADAILRGETIDVLT